MHVISWLMTVSVRYSALLRRGPRQDDSEGDVSVPGKPLTTPLRKGILPMARRSAENETAYEDFIVIFRLSRRRY